MKLLVCAGGTGGGVYPALVVLERLENEHPMDVLWVGSEGGMEADLVNQSRDQLLDHPCSGCTWCWFEDTARQFGPVGARLCRGSKSTA